MNAYEGHFEFFEQLRGELGAVDSISVPPGSHLPGVRVWGVGVGGACEDEGDGQVMGQWWGCHVRGPLVLMQSLWVYQRPP